MSKLSLCPNLNLATVESLAIRQLNLHLVDDAPIACNYCIGLVIPRLFAFIYSEKKEIDRVIQVLREKGLKDHHLMSFLLRCQKVPML